MVNLTLYVLRTIFAILRDFQKWDNKTKQFHKKVSRYVPLFVPMYILRVPRGEIHLSYLIWSFLGYFRRWTLKASKTQYLAGCHTRCHTLWHLFHSLFGFGTFTKWVIKEKYPLKFLVYLMVPRRMPRWVTDIWLICLIWDIFILGYLCNGTPNPVYWMILWMIVPYFLPTCIPT